jgi:exonuclease III
MDSLIKQYKFLSWNVRGLNSIAKQENAKQVVTSFRTDLIYLQETKMMSVDVACIRNSLGHEYEGNWMVLPANGTRGVILVTTMTSTI